MVHIPIALFLQLLVVMLHGNAWAGAVVGTAFFVAREITQAEYRWIEANGGRRAPMPWWKGMDVRLWNSHSITDVLLPAGATIVAALLYEAFGTGG